MVDQAKVYVSVAGADVLAGTVYSHRRRGAESASFAYEASYLGDPRAYALDPQLPLVSGTQQTAQGLALFRAFADSAPDRWGRGLIVRSERLRAARAGEAARSLGEFDLLLGVRDDLRQGALRFRDESTGDFLAGDATGVPMLTDLPTLLSAADRLAGDDDDDADALRLLVRAGSSLGGARPKAHVIDAHGRVAIAKFPSPADAWNVMAWEKVAGDLARSCGIDVPATSLHPVAGRQVLLVERFDRRTDGVRVGYCSALTMLEARDGEGGDYLDIAAVIEERSTSATAELHQLWTRIAFGALIANTDDHLRNHGFLHVSGDAWTLSPAFDMNPNPAPGVQHHATALAGETRISVDAVLGAAPAFRLSPAAALGALSHVVSVVERWPQVAASCGVGRREIDRMAPAFGELLRAREVMALAPPGG